MRPGRRSHWLLSLGALAWAGCASSPAAPPPEAGVPAEALDMLERSDGPDFRIATYLQHEMTQREDHVEVETVIGSDVAMRCRIYGEEILFSDELAYFAHEIDEERGIDSDTRAAAETTAGAIDRYPFQMLAWRWDAADPDAPATRVAASNVRGRGIACALHGAVPAEWFFVQFRSFVREFESTKPYIEPMYDEVYTWRRDGRSIAVTHHRVWTAKGGGLIAERKRSRVWVEGTDVYAYGEDLGEEMQLDGSLLHAWFVAETPSDVKADLSLERDDDVWRLRGTLDKREIDATLEHAGRIDAPFSMDRQLRHAGQDTPVNMALTLWNPGPPERAIRHYGLDTDPGDPSQYRFGDDGGREGLGERDEYGLVKWARFADETEVRTVHRAGRVPPP